MVNRDGRWSVAVTVEANVDGQIGELASLLSGEIVAALTQGRLNGGEVSVKLVHVFHPVTGEEQTID